MTKVQISTFFNVKLYFFFLSLFVLYMCFSTQKNRLDETVLTIHVLVGKLEKQFSFARTNFEARN